MRRDAGDQALMSLTISTMGLIGVSGLTGNVDIVEINLCPLKWRVAFLCVQSF